VIDLAGMVEVVGDHDTDDIAGGQTVTPICQSLPSQARASIAVREAGVYIAVDEVLHYSKDVLIEIFISEFSFRIVLLEQPLKIWQFFV
jgi:hypothetical protein